MKYYAKCIQRICSTFVKTAFRISSGEDFLLFFSKNEHVKQKQPEDLSFSEAKDSFIILKIMKVAVKTYPSKPQGCVV